MRYLLITIMLFNTANGQNSKWYAITKKDAIGYSLMGLSGIAKGYNQAVIHHFYGRGDKFWDNSISWQNKYKAWPSDQSAAFLGSKGIFVVFTDGQHLTECLNTLFLTSGTVFLSLDIKKELSVLPKKDKWKYIVFKKILVPLLIRSAAFEITFNKL